MLQIISGTQVIVAARQTVSCAKLMFKRNGIVQLLFLLALVPALPKSIKADTLTDYTLSFAATSGSPTPISGSFTYDSTNPGFTNFVVDWNGETYDLTSRGINAFLTIGTGCSGEASDAAYEFLVITQSLTGCNVTYRWLAEVEPAFPYGAAEDNFTFIASDSDGTDQITTGGTGPVAGQTTTIEGGGTWSVSPASVPVATTPEPASICLLLSGFAALGLLMAVKRRKVSHGANT